MTGTHYSRQILMKTEFSQQIFETDTHTKFHGNPSSGSRVIPLDRQTDITKLIAASCFCERA